MTTRCKRWVSLAMTVLGLCLSDTANGETYLIPVVVAGVPGLEGSYWDSEVRIVKLSTSGTVTVRRAWVALRGGGFQDDPTTAPSWSLPASEGLAMLVLPGSGLLAGVSSNRAAIGLDIDGAVDVFVHVVDTKKQPPLTDDRQLPVCLPGSGQLLRALTSPLVGCSRATWVTTGADASLRSLFRANVGIVNPNPVPLRVVLQAFPFSALGAEELPVWRSPYVGVPSGEINVPPWGWVQADNMLVNGPMCEGTVNPICWGTGTPRYWPPKAFVFQFLPSTDKPYYAYVSLIYSPTNDPEFVPVLPGGLGATSQ